MEEALELEKYLLVSYKTQSEGEYVTLLWGAFESNYTNGKYEFASLAFHLLYMTFVSFSIWQIRLVREQDFKHALIDNRPLPPETANKQFSGRFVLRIGKDLHRQIAIKALRSGESLNNYCQKILQQAVTVK